MCMFNSSCASLECPRSISYSKNYYDVTNYNCKKYDDLKENVSSKKKLDWLRSNIIGDDLEFISPFGKRKVTYLDCTASGRCLRYIEDYIIQNVLPFYGNTHTCDSYVGQETTKMVAEASNYIKSCLGGSKNDALIFCGSGSTAAIKRLQEVMGITVPSILREKMLQLISNEERWVVFVGPYEHHSNYLSWKQSLAEVVEIGMNEDGLLNLEELEEKLRFYESSKRHMMGSFSACSNVTGTCLDTRRISRLLHQYGAFACFDFASSGPYVEIKMRSGEMDGYDAIFLSPHKFPGGPGSPGILMMNKALYYLGSSPPSTCGGGTVDFVNCFSEEDTIYVNDIEERENAGTPQIIQKIKAALAFWVKEYISCEVIQKQEAYFIEKAMERLLPNPNILILGNTKAKRQATLSFLVYSYTTNDLTSGCNNKSKNEENNNNNNNNNNNLDRIGEDEGEVEETNPLAIVADINPLPSPQDEIGNSGNRNGSSLSYLMGSSNRTNSINSSNNNTGGGEIAIHRVKKEEVETKITAWQTAKVAKINNRFKREDAIISGWENEQVHKATSWMKKVERKLEEKRAKAMEKMQNDIAKAHRKAEERRASAEGKRGTKVAKILEVANLMRAVGRPPAKRSLF